MMSYEDQVKEIVEDLLGDYERALAAYAEYVADWRRRHPKDYESARRSIHQEATE